MSRQPVYVLNKNDLDYSKIPDMLKKIQREYDECSKSSKNLVVAIKKKLQDDSLSRDEKEDLQIQVKGACRKVVAYDIAWEEIQKEAYKIQINLTPSFLENAAAAFMGWQQRPR